MARSSRERNKQVQKQEVTEKTALVRDASVILKLRIWKGEVDEAVWVKQATDHAMKRRLDFQVYIIVHFLIVKGK